MRMAIGLVDIDGHAKKKKWGATIKGFRCEWYVKNLI